MADALGWSIEDTRNILAEIEAAGMLAYCERPALVFLPKAITHNQPANPNIIKSWKAHWDELPECSLRDQALQTLQENLKNPLRPIFDNLFGAELKKHPQPRAAPPLKPSRNGSTNRIANKDQDQDQEQEHPPAGFPKKRRGPTKRPICPRALSLAGCLRDAIATHSEVYAERVGDEQLQSWSLIIDRLVRIDGARHEDVEGVIQWAHIEDPRGFWRPNLLSASALRKQYPRLLLLAKKAGIVQRAVDEGAWKEEHGEWAIRVGQRAAITGGSFDGPALIAAARLEGVPIPELPLANKLASWAATRA